jgi:hypothetical protein
VDFEAGLNAAIKRLRETLGDAAAAPTFIETLPRRGYRFSASVAALRAPGPVEAEDPVRETTAAPVIVAHVPEASAEGRSPPPRFPALAVGLIAVGAALVAIVTLRARSPASGVGEEPRQAGMSRVTNLGTVRRAFVSPDGNDLVYVRDEGLEQSLWIRRGRRADPVRILGPLPGNFESLALAPEDMVYYVFFSYDRTNTSLYRLPIGGGKPELVLRHVPGSERRSPLDPAFRRRRASAGGGQLLDLPASPRDFGVSALEPLTHAARAGAVPPVLSLDA